MKILISLALAAMAAPAAAQDFKPPQGWYLGAGVGASWMQGTADFATINDTNPNYQVAARFSGAAGYKWHDWRAELEPDWVTNDARLTGFGGGSTVAALMANIAYDYRLTNRWMLSLGGGVGVARVSHNIFSTSTTTTTPLFFGGHGTGVAYQGIAGFGYALTRNIELGAEYRYMNTGNTDAVSQVNQAHFHSGQNQIVMASVRWYPFAQEDAPPAPPPMPAPPPPRPLAPQMPAPVMPAPVRTFVIFFDFDKSEVNPAAMAIVSQAVQVVRQNGFIRILVTGHTDTAGSERYNQILSEKRAISVKSAMVGLGVPAGEITTQGKSFHDPLVATGPNVREPQNRRAVIDLDK